MAKRVKRSESAVEVKDPDPENLGPCMLALTEQARRFVVAYAMCGDGTASARSAGYSDSSEACKVSAHRLLHSAKIIDALKEWTRGALEGRGAFAAIEALIEIATDPEHADRFKAADSLADRVGFPRQSQHQMTVEHTDTRSTADLLGVLERFAAQRRPPVIETTAVEVKDGESQAPATA